MIIKIQWTEDGKVYEAGIMKLMKELKLKTTEKEIAKAAKALVRRM